MTTIETLFCAPTDPGEPQNRNRAEIAAKRDAKVPLRRKIGTGWEVSNAALLPVDGDALVKNG